MSLTEYKKRRKFEETPELEKTVNTKTGENLRFVVQKHKARRLHYDFRLELDGALKSWAVPKGPSLDPNQKRLALMVEDHPLDYMTFEGTIPKGNYGAGQVMVWDNGLYHSADTLDPEENPKKLRIGIKKGHLDILLLGKKLVGRFALIKTKGTNTEENAWLLIKQNDEYAARRDVTKDNKSVISEMKL